MNWQPFNRSNLPPTNVEVHTKIDDALGVRNVTTLTWANNLWWFPDKSIYVYYTPTHWALMETANP